MTNLAFQPKLPLDIKDNKFDMLVDILPNIKQKLKMLILTNPGEKIMNPDFGVGIYKILFEPTSGVAEIDELDRSTRRTNIQTIIEEFITSQAEKYLPDVYISKIIGTIEDNVFFLRIDYTYKSFLIDNLEITIEI
jgi:phage baseplate assembly protein W